MLKNHSTTAAKSRFMMATSAALLTGVSFPFAAHAQQEIAEGTLVYTDCPTGQISKDASGCHTEVKVHQMTVSDPQEIERILAQNNWRLATPEEVETAWEKLGLHTGSAFKMADGSHAIPVQSKVGLTNRGVNFRGKDLPSFLVKGILYVDASSPSDAVAAAPVQAPVQAPAQPPQEVIMATAVITNNAVPEPDVEEPPIFCAAPEYPIKAPREGWFCVSDYDMSKRYPGFTGCPENRTPWIVGTRRVCPSPIYAAAVAPAVASQGGPKPVQYFVNEALDRCAYPGNFIYDGWNGSERPMLEAAADKLLARKGPAKGKAAYADLFAKLQADPELRWEFAPFMIEEAWEALVAENPNAAQASFKRRFEIWAGCDANLTARRGLNAWNQHVGKGSSGSTINGIGIEWVEPNPQYSHPALSVFKTKGPSISGFDVTNGGNPMYIGGKGRVALANVIEVFKAKNSPDYPDFADISLVREDFTAVSTLAGIGAGGTFGAAIGVAAGAPALTHQLATLKYNAVKNAGIKAFDLPGGDAISRKVAEDLAEKTFKKLSKSSLKKAFKKMFVNVGTKAATKIGAKVGVKIGVQAGTKVAGSAVGFVGMIVMAAATLGDELAEIIKTKLFEDSLTFDARNYSTYSVDDVLGPDPTYAEKSTVFTLLLKNLIAEPADRGLVTFALPTLDCPVGTILAAGTCTFDIRFQAEPGVQLVQAKALAAANNAKLAEPAEIEQAWKDNALDQYSFGMMSDGNFAVPVQRDHSNFKKGHNVGATGGNQGFFYVPLFVAQTAAVGNGTYIQNADDLNAFLVYQFSFQVNPVDAKPKDKFATWEFKKVGDYHLIYSTAYGSPAYIGVGNAGLQIRGGGVSVTNNPQFLWKLENANGSFYRIENVAKQHQYLNLEAGKLEVDYIGPAEKGALWHIPGRP